MHCSRSKVPSILGKCMYYIYCCFAAQWKMPSIKKVCRSEEQWLPTFHLVLLNTHMLDAASQGSRLMKKYDKLMCSSLLFSGKKVSVFVGSACSSKATSSHHTRITDFAPFFLRQCIIIHRWRRQRISNKSFRWLMKCLDFFTLLTSWLFPFQRKQSNG